jgi:hypothetical protein
VLEDIALGVLELPRPGDARVGLVHVHRRLRLVAQPLGDPDVVGVGVREDDRLDVASAWTTWP